METEEHRKSFDDFFPTSTPSIRSCLSIDRLLKDLGSWKPRLLAADPVTPGKDGLLTFFQDVLLLVKKWLNLCESPKFLGLIRFLDRYLSVVFPRIHTFPERSPQTGGSQRILLVLLLWSPVVHAACGWHCQRSAPAISGAGGAWVPGGTAWLNYTFGVCIISRFEGFFQSGMKCSQAHGGILGVVLYCSQWSFWVPSNSAYSRILWWNPLSNEVITAQRRMEVK